MFLFGIRGFRQVDFFFFFVFVLFFDAFFVWLFGEFFLQGFFDGSFEVVLNFALERTSNAAVSSLDIKAEG